MSKDAFGVYWNAEQLEGLKIKYNSYEEPLFRENSKLQDNVWMSKSCGIAASAMILRNLGATANIYDFRSDKSANVIADPYTVTLANCKYTGKITGPGKYDFSRCEHSPDYLIYGNIAAAFKKQGKSLNSGRKEVFTEQDLMDWIDKYHYVLAYLKKTNVSNGHFVVFTGYDKNETIFVKKYKVYDPAATSYAKGNGVNIASIAAPWNNITFNNISTITYYQ